MRGVTALSVHDFHRLKAGVAHLSRCGPRAVGELLLQAAEDMLSADELLAELDRLRCVPPGFVADNGGGRYVRGAPISVTGQPADREPCDWRSLLAQLLRGHDLPGWEAIYCARLARAGRPSAQQLEVIELIARRLGVRP